MKCSRCGEETNGDEESLLTFTYLEIAKTRTAKLCLNCSLQFVDWFDNCKKIESDTMYKDIKYDSN